MADLIDRDAALHAMECEIEIVGRSNAIIVQNAARMIVQRIKDIPTVDAVPVVRCWECKHKIINENVPHRPLICCRTLRVGETTPEWFCADGER